MTDTSSTALWRQTLDQWVSKPLIQRSIIVLIIVNAAILGMETSPAIMSEWGPLLLRLDLCAEDFQKFWIAQYFLYVALRLGGTVRQ